MDDALGRFAANSTVRNWFPDGFADVDVKHKEREIAVLASRSQDEVCRLHEEVY